MPFGNAEFVSDLFGSAGDVQYWFARWFFDDFDVGPSDPLRPPGAQRFEGGFFGSESGSEVLELALGALGIFLLAGRETAFEESFGVVAQKVGDACCFDDIDAEPDDRHGYSFLAFALSLAGLGSAFFSSLFSVFFSDLDSVDSLAAFLSASLSLEYDFDR